MANRVIPAASKLLKTLRPLNSAASSTTISAISPPIGYAEKPLQSPSGHAITAADTITDNIFNLDDVDKLFASVSTPTLLRASLNLHAVAFEPLVDMGMWVMKSRLMDTPLIRDVIMGIIRYTFYEHFCAGENAVAAGRSVLELNEAGLRGMLVYALEYAGDNDACDRNLQGFLDTVEATKSLPPSSVSFIIMKITAICPMRVLERVSDLLRWQHKDPSFKLPWKLDTLPIFSDNSPLYHTLEKPEPLTPDEERDLELVHQRLLKLSQKCSEANVPLSVDAEYSSVQPAIDYLTYSSAIIYNKDDNPIVYGTIQAYLKDAKERLLLATKAADDMGIPMGFKVVRGAYMSSEAKVASSLGYKSPIHDSIEDTHACYNDCASFMLEKIANGSGGVVLASHNVESGKLAVAKAHEIGIGKVRQKLEFAQLYGMAESLSFGLRNAGFQVSKYMPFGPIELVLPYLLRRAEENRGLLTASTPDRQRTREVLKRRLKAAIF
ncbi:proline dehydrogenase 2 mitochondrial [Prunus yedoensis var. nudiflora]|uniref:Proline dehydrogenase n=1 Tax=Prunus yedoensis var. nudiflora TaxID=2094558 RepID=A0A314Y5T7_PRUYE|nr:proline dehydrogenase 2 mitochondrial [Prunus yedoensis var. nudiflora]PQQ03485.1 proline dehydrogenase 2 mitochondrial [Prunus yedoensis var. nudiflora]